MLVKLALSALLLFSLASEAFSREEFNPIKIQSIINKVINVEIELSGEKSYAQIRIHNGMFRGEGRQWYHLDFFTTSGITAHSLPPEFKDTFFLTLQNDDFSFDSIKAMHSEIEEDDHVGGVQSVLSYLFPIRDLKVNNEHKYVSNFPIDGFFTLLGGGVNPPLTVKSVSDSKVALQSFGKMGLYDFEGIYRYYEFINEIVQNQGTTDMQKSTTSITCNGKLIAKYTLEVR